MFMEIKKILPKVCMIGALTFSFSFAHAEDQYDAEHIADIFYQLAGDKNDPHKKVNHTKGFCTAGEFIPVKGITSKYDIPLLNEKSIPTEARFSLGGGNPHESDKSKSRGMALKIEGQSDSWEIVGLNTEINFAKNPEEFAKFFQARIPKDGKVDVENLKKVTNEIPSFKNYEKYLGTIGVTPSVSNTTYNSVHTFYFKGKDGKLVPARFKFVPTAGNKNLSKKELEKLGDDFLEDDFKAKVAKKPIEYKMMLVLANKNDVTNDTTALWKGKHKEVWIATLRLKEYTGRDCNPEVFMPNMLPKGVEPPKDPLFDLRNDVYSITFGRRQ